MTLTNFCGGLDPKIREWMSCCECCLDEHFDISIG